MCGLSARLKAACVTPVAVSEPLHHYLLFSHIITLLPNSKCGRYRPVREFYINVLYLFKALKRATHSIET